MPVTHTLIASYTVPSTTTSYTFSSIPSTYIDLKLMWSMRNGENTPNRITFNGSSGSYQYRSLFNVGDTGGSATTYGGNTTEYLPLQYFFPSGTIFTLGQMYITNYATASPKSIWTDNCRPNPSSTTDYSNVPMSHNWATNDTITSLTIGATGETLATNTKFWLYGISNS
jgi:hypothetical protein